MTLHGPSLGIGAGITAVTIFVMFFTINVIGEEKELILEQNEIPESTRIG